MSRTTPYRDRRLHLWERPAPLSERLFCVSGTRNVVKTLLEPCPAATRAVRGCDQDLLFCLTGPASVPLRTKRYEEQAEKDQFTQTQARS